MTATTDPRPTFTSALDVARGVIAGVRDDQLGLPTPCTDFDVRQLLHHTLGAVARSGAIARDGGITGEIDVDGPVPPGGYLAAFDEAREAAEASWVDDALLDRAIELPWGTFTGTFVVQMYTLEVALHSWDLAVATGQGDLLDDEVAEQLLPVAHEMLPAEFRGGEMPFEAVVEVADDAAPTDRLAAYSGRRLA